MARSACFKACRPTSVATISTFHDSANESESAMVMAIEYGSSPVEQPALQIRNMRGFFQNFFACNSGSTRFSNVSYTPGYLKKLVSCVSKRSSIASYSRFDFLIARSRSVPRSIPLERRCSRTRVEKKRSRDSSKQIPVRSSISMRISLNSCSLSPCACPWRSVIVFPFSGSHSLAPQARRAKSRFLTRCACRDRPIRFFTRSSRCRSLGRRTELRQRFVQLIRQFDELAHRCHRSARSLRGLPRDAGDDLHRVRHAFRSAHLLFRCQRNFLNQLCRLAHDVRNGVQRASRLVGQPGSTFHFLRAFFHDDYGFVRLRLNRFNEGGDVLRRAAAVFRELPDFVRDDRETATGFARACCFDGRIQCQQVRLFRDVVNHVDDSRNLQ